MKIPAKLTPVNRRSEANIKSIINGAGSDILAAFETETGRDVSVDGSKLDGIETAATADQTDAEVLAAFEAGSGRDVATDGEKLDRLPEYNDIGIMGSQGACVGICPTGFLPVGMTLLPGTETPGHDNWGNYQFREGSIVVYVPIHWVKIGTGSNGMSVNEFSVVKYSTYVDETTANAAGYFLPRCFKDGGNTKIGIFIDKYMCSKNAFGTGFVASSLKNGLPISTHADHNPIVDLTACAGNYYYETINAAKARDGENGNVSSDPQWFVNPRFVYSMLFMLSLAHGQAATSTTHCAWYDVAGIENFPKGCNNNALGDANDGTISYTSDGYSNCGKTGSGVHFEKTTHNGQACGIADLNGLMYEISIGVTRDGTNFYVADESTAMKDFTSGSSQSTDHWGATGIAAMMTPVIIDYMTNDGWTYLGSGANQVFSEAVSGNAALLTALGMPKDADGHSAAGTNLFGKDGMYRYLRNELCVRSCGHWDASLTAGPGCSSWNYSRTSSIYYVGFRCACYPERAAIAAT